MTTSSIRRPLDGMLVLDLGQIYNGPYAGLQLSFMGARVLKIEPPEGDVLRRRKRETEPYPLVMLNSNKESVVLDLKQPKAKEIFLALVEKADVLIENFAAGVMDRLGLGYDVLSKLNPRLIMASISAFGRSGPLSHKVGYDFIAQAFSGLMHMTGDPNGPPMFVGLGIGDQTSGVHAFSAIGFALFYRERTGIGQYIDIAMVDALYHMHEVNIQVWATTNGEYVPKRMGSQHELVSPCG